jgi:hypothetical protein
MTKMKMNGKKFMIPPVGEVAGAWAKIKEIICIKEARQPDNPTLSGLY